MVEVEVGVRVERNDRIGNEIGRNWMSRNGRRSLWYLVFDHDCGRDDQTN